MKQKHDKRLIWRTLRTVMTVDIQDFIASNGTLDKLVADAVAAKKSGKSMDDKSEEQDADLYR